MKRLLPTFIDKIHTVLDQYHSKIIEVAGNYDEILKNKFWSSIIKNK